MFAKVSSATRLAALYDHSNRFPEGNLRQLAYFLIQLCMANYAHLYQSFALRDIHMTFEYVAILRPFRLSGGAHRELLKLLDNSLFKFFAAKVPTHRPIRRICN